MIKSSWPNRAAIGRKIDSKQYESILIMRKLIPISSVTNLRKNRVDRTVHTPSTKLCRCWICNYCRLQLFWHNLSATSGHLNYQTCCLCSVDDEFYRLSLLLNVVWLSIAFRDGNFALPCLTHPFPLSPTRVFPTSQRLWGWE